MHVWDYYIIGFLNILNILVDNRLPNEKGLIWLLQFFQATMCWFWLCQNNI